MTNRLSLYAAGGTGINLTKKVPEGLFSDNASNGVARLDALLIDTSDSNFRKLNPNFKTFQIEENVDGEKVRGGGKERGLNLDVIRAETKNMLLELPPSNVLNIVMTGLAGGTGGVVSAVLVAELLRRNKPVVVIAVGSLASGKEIENTHRSLLSFESIAVSNNKPVTMYYLENSENYSRNDVDNELIEAVSFLTLLASGQNDELDERDVENLFNYIRVTDHPAALVCLDITNKSTQEVSQGKGKASKKDREIFAVASLVSNTGQNANYKNGDIAVQYQAIGILPECADKGVHDLAPIHFTIVDGLARIAIDNLHKNIKTAQEARAAQAPRRTLLETAGVESNDVDGLII